MPRLDDRRDVVPRDLAVERLGQGCGVVRQLERARDVPDRIGTDRGGGRFILEVPAQVIRQMPEGRGLPPSLVSPYPRRSGIRYQRAGDRLISDSEKSEQRPQVVRRDTHIAVLDADDLAE